MNQKPLNPYITALLLLLTLGLPTVTVALTSDRQQPMHIEADRAELDEKTGVSIYSGSVKVTQGTLVLTGNRMQVFNRNDTLEKIIIDGAPATYRQRPDGKPEDLRAEALHMEYHARPERMVLQQKGVVWQGSNTFRSDRIVYDVARDQVQAGDSKGGQRVHIILQPKPQTDSQP